MPSSTKATLLKAEASGRDRVKRPWGPGQHTRRRAPPGPQPRSQPQLPAGTIATVDTDSSGRTSTQAAGRCAQEAAITGRDGRTPRHAGPAPGPSSSQLPRPRPGGGRARLPGPVSPRRPRRPRRVAGDGALRPRTLTRLRGSRIGEVGERAVPAYFLRSGPSPLPLGQPPRPRHLETSRPSAILTSLPVPAADALTALLRPGTIERTKRRQGQSCFRSNPTSDWIAVAQEPASFRSIVD